MWCRDRNLHAARGGSRKKLVASMRERGALPSARFLPRVDIPTSQVPRVASEFHSSVSGLVHTGSGPHPQGRLRTTPSAPSGVVLHHYGHGAVQVSSTAVRHHRTAQVRGTPSFTSTVALLTPQVVPTPGLDCHPGFPFVLDCLVYASSGEYVHQGCPADAGRRLTAWSKRPSTSCFPFLEEGGIAICHFDSSRGATILSLVTPV